MGYGRCSKREYACEAITVMEKGFSELMPLKITAFDAQGINYVSHEVVKDFDEIQTDVSCSYNFLIQGRGGCGNKDGYSIRIATQELLERNEDKKLLLILSDGAPSDYSSSKIARADVKSAVDEARESGITVLPIYFADILSDNEINEYKQMYGENIVATHPEEIEAKLLEIMKNFYFSE